MKTKQTRVNSLLKRSTSGANDLRTAIPDVGPANERAIHALNKSSRISFKHKSPRRTGRPILRKDDGELARVWPSNLCLILGCNKTAAHPHTKEEVTSKLGWNPAAEELFRSHYTLNHDWTRQRRMMWRKSWSPAKILLRTQGRVSVDGFDDEDYTGGLGLLDGNKIPRSVPSLAEGDEILDVFVGEQMLTPISSGLPLFDARQSSQMEVEAVAASSICLKISIVTDQLERLGIEDRGSPLLGLLG